MICQTSQNRPLFRRWFIEPISDGSHRSCIVLINGIQLHFDFLTRLPIQKKESNHWSILLFFHYCKQTRTCPLSTVIKTKLLDKSVWNFDWRLSKDGIKRWYTDFESVTSSVVKHGYLSCSPRIFWVLYCILNYCVLLFLSITPLPVFL